MKYIHSLFIQPRPRGAVRKVSTMTSTTEPIAELFKIVAIHLARRHKTSSKALPEIHNWWSIGNYVDFQKALFGKGPDGDHDPADRIVFLVDGNRMFFFKRDLSMTIRHDRSWSLYSQHSDGAIRELARGFVDPDTEELNGELLYWSDMTILDRE